MSAQIINIDDVRAKRAERALRRREADPFEALVQAWREYLALFGWRI